MKDPRPIERRYEHALGIELSREPTLSGLPTALESSACHRSPAPYCSGQVVSVRPLLMLIPLRQSDVVLALLTESRGTTFESRRGAVAALIGSGAGGAASLHASAMKKAPAMNSTRIKR
jgi:hypothetical protein